MEIQKKNVRHLAHSGLRLFLMNKIKKHGVQRTALAVQRALHLPSTGAFDLRTLTMLSKGWRRRAYERFKSAVTMHLA